MELEERTEGSIPPVVAGAGAAEQGHAESAKDADLLGFFIEVGSLSVWAGRA